MLHVQLNLFKFFQKYFLPITLWPTSEQNTVANTYWSWNLPYEEKLQVKSWQCLKPISHTPINYLKKMFHKLLSILIKHKSWQCILNKKHIGLDIDLKRLCQNTSLDNVSKIRNILDWLLFFKVF